MFDAEGGRLQVGIVERQRDQFGATDSSRVERFQDGAVANVAWLHRQRADLMAGRPPTKEAPIFGQRLAALRRAKGLSQTQLAELLETTRKMIDDYERRAGNPSLDLIQRAAEALDVSVAELLGSQP